MIDSHCHLADEAFAADLDAVVTRARAAGVERALCVLSAGDNAESAAAARLRALWPEVRFSAGVHPHQSGRFAGRIDEAVQLVRRAIAAEGARALGEVGLDYHYDFSPREVQRDLFAAQVALARELRLPLVVHTREATADTFDVLHTVGRGDVRGVFHCFTGEWPMAARALELGFYVSLAGVVTFPRAAALREVAARLPADRLLIETDAPYLAPVPYRGKRNEPGFVPRVGEIVAEVRGLGVDELAALLTRNYSDFLGPNVSQATA